MDAKAGITDKGAVGADLSTGSCYQWKEDSHDGLEHSPHGQTHRTEQLGAARPGSRGKSAYVFCITAEHSLEEWRPFPHAEVDELKCRKQILKVVRKV